MGKGAAMSVLGKLLARFDEAIDWPEDPLLTDDDAADWVRDVEALEADPWRGATG